MPPDVAPVVLGFNYEGRNLQPIQIQHSTTFFGFGNPAFLSGADNLAVFWPYFNCACAKTAISELPVKIVTSPVFSAIQIFFQKAIIRRTFQTTFSGVFLTVQIEKKLPYFCFRSVLIWRH